jgi:hypothetical protein
MEARRRTHVLALNDFSQAVAGIYDASMDVGRWPDTLSVLARIFGSTGAQINVASGLDSVSFIRVWGFPEDMMAKYVPRYLALSPTDPRADLLAAKYKATHCRQVVSDEVLRASDIYKEALAPLGIEYSMCFMVPIDQELMGFLSVMRGPERSLFRQTTVRISVVSLRISAAPSRCMGHLCAVVMNSRPSRRCSTAFRSA